GAGDLVEQRSDQVVVVAVDQQHVHRPAGETLRALETGEAGADDDDLHRADPAKLSGTGQTGPSPTGGSALQVAKISVPAIRDPSTTGRAGGGRRANGQGEC